MVDECASIVQAPIWCQVQYDGDVARVLHAIRLHKSHVIVGLYEVTSLVPAALQHHGLSYQTLEGCEDGLESCGVIARATGEPVRRRAGTLGMLADVGAAVATCHVSSGTARSTVSAASATAAGSTFGTTTKGCTVALEMPWLTCKAAARVPTDASSVPTRSANFFLLNLRLPHLAIVCCAAFTSSADGGTWISSASEPSKESASGSSPRARASARAMPAAMGSAIIPNWGQ
eukprot:CAMPEP_0183505028 /NCGR_PEP_ID=MMETSP0371-20130417/6391_1 /TAXON_ID=268820 /ORGANISM="Peridinium aciculiferum, Strain PAER-2" /LENGTH=231 /DNA_ID=CAMNT_0025700617 /DNA_START=257 /DNA_END=953 /DNA_ORIENTATION=+